MTNDGTSEMVATLEHCRARERAQTRFYRALAARAELQGQDLDAERLNELHADEQHHLSRLTARLLELGGEPAELPASPVPEVPLEGWESAARTREGEEVEWYEQLLAGRLDPDTRALFEEILESERHHRDVLGGKWMPA
jgi:rubrerythrin